VTAVHPLSPDAEITVAYDKTGKIVYLQAPDSRIACQPQSDVHYGISQKPPLFLWVKHFAEYDIFYGILVQDVDERLCRIAPLADSDRAEVTFNMTRATESCLSACKLRLECSVLSFLWRVNKGTKDHVESSLQIASLCRTSSDGLLRSCTGY
jgi:hypothetical protein